MAKLLDVLIHCNQGKVVEQQVYTLTKTDLGPGHWGIPVGVLTPNRDIGTHPATVDGALLYYRLAFANLDVTSSVRLNLSDVNYTTWEKYRLWDARLQKAQRDRFYGGQAYRGRGRGPFHGPPNPIHHGLVRELEGPNEYQDEPVEG